MFQALSENAARTERVTAYFFPKVSLSNVTSTIGKCRSLANNHNKPSSFGRLKGRVDLEPGNDVEPIISSSLSDGSGCVHGCVLQFLSSVVCGATEGKECMIYVAY